jgi:Uma2 family endonuclease
MSSLHKKPSLTEQAYLEFEELSDIKHEYVAGEIYAMAGASERHNRITGNIFLTCVPLHAVVVAVCLPVT